jgi:hypothetical protein
VSAGGNTITNVLAPHAGAEHSGRNENGDLARSPVCLFHISLPTFLFEARAAPRNGIQRRATLIGNQFDAGSNSVKIDPIRQSASQTGSAPW